MELFLLRYWKLFIVAAIVAGSMGFVWHITAENFRLKHENQSVKAVYLQNKKSLEELEADKAKTAKILTENAQRNQAAEENTNKLKQQLKDLMEKSSEEIRKCYDTNIDVDTNQWLREQSNKDGD